MYKYTCVEGSTLFRIGDSAESIKSIPPEEKYFNKMPNGAELSVRLIPIYNICIRKHNVELFRGN